MKACVKSVTALFVILSTATLAHPVAAYGLDSPVCAEWNGFLSDLIQIVEVQNTSSGSIQVAVELIDFAGSVRDTVSFPLAVNDQGDVIVNALAGFSPNTYGQVCVTVISGALDAVDGQLLFYKVDGDRLEYAFASIFTPGRVGSQFVTYNTYFPTYSQFEIENFAAGFVQVANEESTVEGGELIFYDQGGSELGREEITLPPRTRFDVATHTVGPRRTGLVEWRPINPIKRFRVSQNRYFFDAPVGGTIRTAFSIPAMPGIGAAAAAVIDARTSGSSFRLTVLELSNTSNQTVTAKVSVFTSEGVASASPVFISLAARQTFHVILNGLLGDQRGNVIVDASIAGSIIVNRIEYGLSGGPPILSYSDAIAVASANGSELRGTFNNYLGGCLLQLANVSGVDAAATMTVTRFDGTVLQSNTPLQVKARGSITIGLCPLPPDLSPGADFGYGQVLIIPSSPGLLVGDVVRLGYSGRAYFSVPF